MRILIAGCGYVGSRLAEVLLTQGHTVYGLRRDTSRLPDDVIPVTADLCESKTLGALPKALDYVFYTASATGYGEAAYRAAYVDGLRNFIDALDGQSIKRVFFTSSTGVYNQNDGTWIDETSPAEANRPTAQALRDGESLVLSTATPGTVVRFSGIYGPTRTRLIDSVVDGTARLERDQIRYLNHIHRDDCAGFLAHLITVPKPAERYLATDDEPRTRNELLTWIAETTGAPLPPFSESTPASETTSVRGGNRRYRNARMRETGYVLAYPTFREGYGALIAARTS